MALNLEELKSAALAADQGVWSIGQSAIETNGGMIWCHTDYRPQRNGYTYVKSQAGYFRVRFV